MSRLHRSCTGAVWRPDLSTLARGIAAGAVAEVGRGRALRWALGLLSTVRSPADLRDVALIAWAVLTVAPAP